ncbi:MAG: hypothetical protein SFT92_02025 [Rickettsiales bacterium]|nr:hypothetical protein [Rickettsiales bacterium]
MSSNSPDNMQPPAGHPTPEHGKGGGTCPFMAMITQMDTQAPSERLQEQMGIMKEYGQFLNTLLSASPTKAEQFYADPLTTTPSFAPYGRDTNAVKPGLEYVAHTIHSQFRVLASKMGNSLSLKELERNEETRPIAESIRRFDASCKAHEKLANRLYSRAQAIEDERDYIDPDFQRDKRIFDMDWCRHLVPPEEMMEYGEQLSALSHTINKEFMYASAALNSLEKIPIISGSGLSRSTRWVDNTEGKNFSNTPQRLGVKLWHLKLFSEGQDDPARRGSFPLYRSSLPSVSYGLQSSSGQTTNLLNKTVSGALTDLFAVAPEVVLRLVTECNQSIGKAIRKDRESVLLFSLYDNLLLSRNQDNEAMKLLAASGRPFSPEDGLTPKTAATLCDFIANRGHAHEYQSALWVLARALRQEPKQDPCATARIVQCNPCYVEALVHARKDLCDASYSDDRMIATSLIDMMIDPRSKTRRPSDMGMIR